MAARALSPEQREAIRGVVLEFAVERGFDGWRISDLVARTGISSRTLYKYYPSKEFLVLDAMIERSRVALDAVPPPDAATPGARVIGTLQRLNAMLVAFPSGSRAMFRALTCGQEAVSPMLRTFNEALHSVVANALAESGPSEKDYAAAKVLQQVWFASTVSWASNVCPFEDIEGSVIAAMDLMGLGD